MKPGWEVLADFDAAVARLKADILWTFADGMRRVARFWEWYADGLQEWGHRVLTRSIERQEKREGI
jgi:hypothetical protein